MNHLDDDAEAYALGLTEPERGAEIEAHLAACAPCRARVIAAEEAAASLAAALPPMPAAAAGAPAPRRAWWPALATAAAVAFAASAAFEGVSANASASQLARTDAALTAVASSHFAHATLASDPGVVAKALYARDGSWCYVLVRGVPRGAHVTLRSGASVRDAGPLERGDPATLFVRPAVRADAIAVVAGDRVVAHGALADGPGPAAAGGR